MQTVLVKAIWDSEAKAWVATSENLPGLVTEAPDLSALEARLHALIPELLAENDQLEYSGEPEVPFELLIQDTLRPRKAC